MLWLLFVVWHFACFLYFHFDICENQDGNGATDRLDDSQNGLDDSQNGAIVPAANSGLEGPGEDEDRDAGAIVPAAAPDPGAGGGGAQPLTPDPDAQARTHKFARVTKSCQSS